ncbi:SIMPL domain-containing protein [Longibacter salinarum]|uniref:SIMPL domain-containing protein n=1 Tax=Longibacter salinarum TaxID=1850348 RepID=A0A2A8CYW8_9BACT|nr:SIMPL domain-containing protein [Longibacter salinarum]PEN13919.1 SIMPL domain-containing protein [Longibacter salinarum]
MRLQSLRFLTLIALFLALPLTAMAQTDASASTDRTVTVSGEGEASAEPDKATVRFAVVSRAKEAEDARTANADAARNAMNAVRSLEIDEADIQMESLTLQPRRQYNRQTGETEELGYEATRRVRVELSDLEKLPALIADVVEQGANRLDGVQYDLEDRSAVRNEALQKAAESAREKAELLASTLGASLGPVHQIREQQYSGPQPRFDVQMEAMAMKSGEDSGEPEAFAAGRISVEATVQVTFLLQ